MAIDFPASPSTNDTFTSGALVYTFDGTKWTAQPAGVTGGTKIEVSNTKAEIVDTGSDGRFVVTTEGTERLRVDPSGHLLLGTSSARSVGVEGASEAPVQVETPDSLICGLTLLQNRSSDGLGPNLRFGKTRGSAVGSNTVVQNGDDLGTIQFAGADGTDIISLGAKISAHVDGTPGANDLPGRIVFSTTSDGAASPTERMRITNDGDTFIGKSGFAAGTAGIELQKAGAVYATRDGNVCGLWNRLSSDGDIIIIQQATVTEGSISVSGTTVSYNGAHLSRWSQLPNGAVREEILRGTLLSNLDEMCEWEDAPRAEVLWEEGDELPEGISVGDVKEPAYAGGLQNNEQLNRMKVSDLEGDRNVSGVFQAWDDDDDTYENDFYCAMTGDFIIRIAEGVTVARGDLLMSAGDGTAMPQDDDIIRSKTIAKVTSTNVTCTYDDGSYCVPCVLMAC